MPMRFADLDGTTIDVYQAATQMTDESGQTYPFTVDTLLDRALGPLGYYGVFTTNHHTDSADDPAVGRRPCVGARARCARGLGEADARLARRTQRRRRSDRSRGPGRADVHGAPGATANGLTAMVPASARGGALARPYARRRAGRRRAQVVKGVEVRVLRRRRRRATSRPYAVDERPRSSHVAATPGRRHRRRHVDDGRTGRFPRRVRDVADRADREPASATTRSSPRISCTLAGLAPLTTYYYRVVSADAGGNASTSPARRLHRAIRRCRRRPASSSTRPSPTSRRDAGRGHGDYRTRGRRSDAERRGIGASSAARRCRRTGRRRPGTRAAARRSRTVPSPSTARAPGRSPTSLQGGPLEFVATFGGAPFQHVGFAVSFDAPPWAMFTTLRRDAVARTHYGVASTTRRSSHRARRPARRIASGSTGRRPGTTYSVDGTVVATHAIGLARHLRPAVSDFTPGGGVLTLDWMRMRPFASAGTFLSRVFDAGEPAELGHAVVERTAARGDHAPLGVRTATRRSLTPRGRRSPPPPRRQSRSARVPVICNIEQS